MEVSNYMVEVDNSGSVFALLLCKADGSRTFPPPSCTTIVPYFSALPAGPWLVSRLSINICPTRCWKFVDMSSSSTDLWASALRDLTENDRQQLTFYDGQSRLEILSDLQVLAESAKDQCIKKRWRFSRPGRNGETIVLRDIFTKMVVWINMFKRIGDTVVQYDPGHAALPWAGVRFILQIAVGDIVRFDFVVEGAESIARMIGRFAIFEEIYLRRTSKASVDLEHALIRLYSLILTYLSKAKSFFDQSFTKRALKSVFVAGDEFEYLAKNMDLEYSNVDRCAATLNTENQNNISDSLEALSIAQCDEHSKLMDILRSIDGPILRMSRQLEDIEDFMDKSKRYEILRWVSAQPYLDHHKQISVHALAGTGRWLLEDPVYVQWHKGSASSLLWLHGKVGAGKSTLVSIVIEDAKRRSQAGQGPPPVYFYCSRNAAEPERSDPAAILSSIVRQLSCAEPGLPLLAPVIEKYESSGQGFGSRGLQIEESCEIIAKLIEYYPMTTIVIDALDECNPDTRETLLEAIETLLQESSLGLIKVFLSSRDDQDIVCTLRDYPNLDIVSSKNVADIEAFVREETERLVKRRRLLRNSHEKDSLKALIIDEVSRRADGMFRWASLQLELLCTLKLDQDVRARLGRIPPKLEELYQDLYEKNLLKYPGGTGQSVIRSILKWLLCAQRSMKSSEFCTAVGLNTVPMEELTKEKVLDLCHNFVVFDDSLDVFRFAHVSVREFLEKDAEYMATSCHILAAETCILYFIGLTDWSVAKAFLQRHYTLELRGIVASNASLLGGFHNYSMIYWAKHCQLIGEDGRRNDPHFERIFRFFLSDASDDRSPLNTWIQSSQRRSKGGSLQHYIYPQAGWISQAEWSPEDRGYYVACVFEFCEIIRMGLNMATRKGWHRGCRVAIQNRKGEALKTLLSNCSEDEISLDLVTRVAFFMDLDTLDWVIQKSKTEVTSLLGGLIDKWGAGKELIENLIVRYKPSEISQTLLEYAAGFCSAITFESLLRDSDDTAISWHLLLEQAAREENNEVVKLLILDKEDFPITGNLMRAVAKSGDENSMRLLLDREDPGESMTDLLVASISNKNETVLPLILRRVITGGLPEEAICEAIQKGNERALSALLDGGYPMSQSLVNQAAAQGNVSILRLLLDRGGLITGLVLRCAAGNKFGGVKLMSLLLAEVTDYYIIMEEMIDMMRIAAFYNLTDVMKLLLERAEFTVVPEDVLVMAVGHPWGLLMRILSSREWDMTREVLEAMMRHPAEESMQLILDRMQDMEITEKILLAAAGNDQFGDRLVGLLLDRADLPNGIGPLLEEAAGNSTSGLEIIALLQRRVGNIKVTQEAMRRAAQKGSIQTMKFLLDHNSAPITEAIVLGAIRHGLGMLRLVLDRAVDFVITRKFVCAAARFSNLQCLKLVWTRASPAEIVEDDTKDLAQAAIENRLWAKENLKFLLAELENLIVGPEAMMSIASKSKDSMPILKLLINNRIKLPITTAVLEAAAANVSNDGSLMAFFIEKSDGVGLTDEHFRAAAGAGHQDVLQLLSKHCGMADIPKKWLDIVTLHHEVDSSFYTIIHPSPMSSIKIDLDPEKVTALLDQGVEPDVPDSRGLTPLCHAAFLGNIIIVQALLAAGANPSWRDRTMRTPLFFAAAGGHCGIVEILLDLGVKTQLEDEDGETPASVAKSWGQIRAYRLLERRRGS